MVSRKRGAAEMESPAPFQENSLLTPLRNMWEFANIMQYIYIFGKAVKVDEDFDIEVHSPLPYLIYEAFYSQRCYDVPTDAFVL